MNIPTEENNLPIFKYNPEATSQYLIQTNEPQEFVQVPNICDDLLLAELDGTVTWTLGGLPILLNGQNDTQPLLVNQTNETVDDLQPPQETLEDILEHTSNRNQFVENTAENNDNTEIVYPLEISEKSFLTDNSLFINNDVINDQADVTPNCALVSNDNELNTEKTNQEISEEYSETEIQSSDVSSQEAFIDINGMLIPQQSSVLNLNCPDLLFNIQEPQNSSNIVLSTDLIPKKKSLKRKRRLKNESVTEIQNYKSEETVENVENKVQNNSVFSCHESVNSLIKVLNDDGTTTILNIDGTLFNDKCISKETANIVACDGSITEEFQAPELPVDDEPDSTVANDTEDTLNIDDLATIITAYQCKKCDFTCNDRDQFLIHFRDAHIQTQPVYKVQPEFIVPNPLEQVQIDFGNNDLSLRGKKIKLPNNKNLISILCTNGGIPVLNNNLVNKTVPNLDEANLPNIEQVNIKLTSGDLQNEIISSEEYELQQLNNTKIESKKINNLHHPQFIFDDEEFTQIAVVSEEETEKKIMRIKKRNKSKKVKLIKIPQETNTYLPNILLEINPVENEDNNIMSSQITNNLAISADNPAEESDKQMIYLCSQCADQFLTVEDCRAHMIKVHKLCAVETTEKANSTVVENSSANHDSLQVVEDTNKQLIDKILGQEILKSRKHKCPIKGCPYRFAKLELLSRHETCHVEGNRSQFRCPECGEMQPSWRICSIHLWRCHQLDVDLYACPLCDYKGSTSVKLKHHIKIHSDEREYICPECGRGFKQPSQLRNHRVIHLENQPSWYSQKRCDICGKTFADSKCLKKHIQAVHSKLKPFICSVCGHSCARKAMLQLHLRQHTGEKPYSCSLCFYKTGDHNSLRRHKMRHSGARPYKCPHCDYTAIQSNSYKNHLASKHPGMFGAYSCTECSFKTVNEDAYVSHMNDHKNNLIPSTRKKNTNEKVTDENILNILTNSNSELSSNNENEIFSGSGECGQNNISFKKKIDLEDDETQNCFLSLSDLTDEQTVDTGGITIPADPEPVHM